MRDARLELAVIVPTYNERANVGPLVEALGRALAGLEYEILVVDDDSEDGTAEAARALGVRVLKRIGRRGLSSAVVEGMMATSAPYVAVIDADLQHDESILPEMLRRAKEGGLDLVVGTRNAGGGSMGSFAGWRVRLSEAGRWLSRSVARTELSDPMSGFFVADRRFVEEVVRNLSMTGFKILLDLLASARRAVRVAEVGYTFRARRAGASKLDMLVGLEYLQLILDQWVGDYVPVSYVIFGLVGAVGVVVNLGLLVGLEGIGWAFGSAFVASSAVVMGVNYFLNNALTFRAYRRRGWGLWLGLVKFYAACGVGLAVNLELAGGLRAQGVRGWVAGLLGIVLSSVWNYWMTTILVWRVHRRRRG